MRVAAFNYNKADMAKLVARGLQQARFNTLATRELSNPTSNTVKHCNL
jgi:hypothetical protein